MRRDASERRRETRAMDYFSSANYRRHCATISHVRRFISGNQAAIEREFSIVQPLWRFEPSYNVAPTNPVPNHPHAGRWLIPLATHSIAPVTLNEHS
jgi:hypothetical protein